MRLVKTVDPGGNGPEWDGRVGFVPTILEETAPAAENTIALVCGPPIMIKFTLPVLEKLGFSDEQVYTTLENRMKCGLGKCGRCNVGNVYVCKDGPVFTASTGQGNADGVLKWPQPEKNYKKKSSKRSVKSGKTVMSTVVTVRVSDEEKERIDEIMMNLDIKRYSDVMRMALHMMKPNIRYIQVNMP